MFIKITREKRAGVLWLCFCQQKLCLRSQTQRPSPLLSPRTNRKQPTRSCKSNKSLDQYCKYNLYSPTNFSQELFVMKLVFCLQTKIGWLGGEPVTSQNLNQEISTFLQTLLQKWNSPKTRHSHSIHVNYCTLNYFLMIDWPGWFTECLLYN